MHKDPRIELRIAAILTGTGLPMERRREVAEELRGHLQQNIASKCASGLQDNDAIASALAEFGSPQVLRKQLRAQQRMLDRRQAFAKLRRQIWMPIIYAGLFVFWTGFFSIVPGMRTQPSHHIAPILLILHRVIVFVGLFFLVAGFMYVGNLFEYQIKRLRPRHEYHFLKSCLRWMAAVGLVLVATLTLVMFLMGFWTPLVCTWVNQGMLNNCFANHFAWTFSHSFMAAWLESAVRNFGLCGLGVLGFGLGLSLYEHSRCVDEPAISEVE